MVWLKKAHAGAAPGYTWENDGDVLDVDEELALELLERPGGEFSEGEPPEDAGNDGAHGDGDAGDAGDGDVEPDVDSTETKKPSRRRTKVSE